MAEKKRSFGNAILAQAQGSQIPQPTQGQQNSNETQNASFIQNARGAQDTQAISRLTVAFDAQLMEDMKALANITGESVTELINRVMKVEVDANREKISALLKLRAGKL